MKLQTTAATEEITARSELDDPRHPLNLISEKIRDSIFKIHRNFGPGLLESAYEECLEYDLIQNKKLKVERQKILPLQFEGLRVSNSAGEDLMEIFSSLRAQRSNPDFGLPRRPLGLLAMTKLRDI